MRREFGKTLVELAEEDNDIILLVGDIGYRIFDDFKKKFPERFINFGVREQSMICAASGMAIKGAKPYVYTITPFLIERAFEQIKLDIIMQNVNVKLVGYADYPTQGPTHAEINPKRWLEDLNDFAKFYQKSKQREGDVLKFYFPRDSEETRQMILESYEHEKPTFISLKRDKNIK